MRALAFLFLHMLSLWLDLNPSLQRSSMSTVLVVFFVVVSVFEIFYTFFSKFGKKASRRVCFEKIYCAAKLWTKNI